MFFGLGLTLGGQIVVSGGGAPATPATVDSVTAGTWAAPDQPLTVTATGASNGDGVYWVIVPAADDAPSASEVRAGQANGGGAPTESGNDTWPGPFSDTLVSNIARGSYKLYVVIDNGALSNVGASDAFTVDTTAPVIASPLASESSGDIDWSVTSNEANGEIYAALRLSANPVLSAENIINGTGDAVDTDSDDTPAADDTNGGSFLAPAVGTYRVDMVQVDDYGNVSNVVTSAEVEITSADAMADDTGKLYWYGYDDTTRSGTDVTAVNDKGGAAFALNSIGAFSAPTQANAGAPMVFLGTSPSVIQTATSAAGNRLMMTHLLGGGSLRFFAVVDGPSLGTGSATILAESVDSNSNNGAIQFGICRNPSTGNFQPTIVGRRLNVAFLSTAETSVHSSVGLAIFEVVVTQTSWEILINGSSELTGTVTAANLPSVASVWTSLGARADNASAASAFTGDLYDVFVTKTADSTHGANVRDQLAAAFSITL